MATATGKAPSRTWHTQQKSALLEKQWLQSFLDRPLQSSRSVLKISIPQEESWWFAALSQMISQKHQVKVQRIDLTDLTSRNKGVNHGAHHGALHKLRELEQASLFTTGDLYYILFPYPLAKDLLETTAQILKGAQESVLLVNPPKKLLEELQLGKETPILDLTLEKPWDRKERWTLFAQSLLRKRLQQGIMGISSISSNSEQEVSEQMLSDLLSHLLSYWPLIWKEIGESLVQSTLTSRMALQQECEKIAFFLVKKCQQYIDQGQVKIEQEELKKWIDAIQTELLYYPNEESVWEISTVILDQKNEIFSSIDRWIEKDPSAIMTASVLRKQWSQALVWMGTGEVPTALARSAKRKQQMQDRWKRVVAQLPLALSCINASIYSLKNGAQPKVQLQCLIGELFALCRFKK